MWVHVQQACSCRRMYADSFFVMFWAVIPHSESFHAWLEDENATTLIDWHVWCENDNIASSTDSIFSACAIATKVKYPKLQCQNRGTPALLTAAEIIIGASGGAFLVLNGAKPRALRVLRRPCIAGADLRSDGEKRTSTERKETLAEGLGEERTNTWHQTKGLSQTFIHHDRCLRMHKPKDTWCYSKSSLDKQTRGRKYTQRCAQDRTNGSKIYGNDLNQVFIEAAVGIYWRFSWINPRRIGLARTGKSVHVVAVVASFGGGMRAAGHFSKIFVKPWSRDTLSGWGTLDDENCFVLFLVEHEVKKKKKKQDVL